jgi:hypothetical protein
MVSKILQEFFSVNIKKLFWGIIVAIIIKVLWDAGMEAEAKTYLVGLAGYCISQIKSNPLSDEVKAGIAKPAEAKQTSDQVH